MPCIPRPLFFPGQVLNRLGQFVFHSAGPGPPPTQRVCAGVSGIFPQEKLAPLSLNLRCACGIHIFDLMSFYPQLQQINYHCMHAHMHVYYILTGLCYVLCAWPFNWRARKEMGQVSALRSYRRSLAWMLLLWWALCNQNCFEGCLVEHQPSYCCRVCSQGL